MRRLRNSLLVLAGVLLLPAHALGDNKISFAACSPTGGTATIEGEGSYEINTGATLKGVTLYAVQSCGGVGGEQPCTTCGGSWSGTITFNGLGAGTYAFTVYARLHITVSGESEYYDTAVATITLIVQ